MRAAGALLIFATCCCCTGRPARSQAEAAAERTDTAGPHEAAAPAPSAGDTTLVERYPNGRPRYLILAKDSGECNELHLTYYENGRLKSKGCQGTVRNAQLSTGMSVGTWSYFDSVSGRLDSTFFYNNAEAEKAFIEKKTYHANGALKSVEVYNNYILYETDMVRKGAWKYYGENGKLLRTVNY